MNKIWNQQVPTIMKSFCEHLFETIAGLMVKNLSMVILPRKVLKNTHNLSGKEGKLTEIRA